MKNLNERAIAATAKYLDRRGYEIITTENAQPAPIVVKEIDTVVFVAVIASTDELTEEEPARKDMEKAAAEYLAQAPEMLLDTRFRFDVVSLQVIGDDRALIRHHINAYSEA